MKTLAVILAVLMMVGCAEYNVTKGHEVEEAFLFCGDSGIDRLHGNTLATNVFVECNDGRQRIFAPTERQL